VFVNYIYFEDLYHKPAIYF